MRKIGPGMYVDGTGAMHIRAEEMCEHLRVPPTPGQHRDGRTNRARSAFHALPASEDYRGLRLMPIRAEWRWRYGREWRQYRTALRIRRGSHCTHCLREVDKYLNLAQRATARFSGYWSAPQ
jgi:hypothetical protein